MSLFTPGKYSQARGRTIDWTLNIESLDDNDWRCFANLIVERHPNFQMVKPVSSGGHILSDVLEPFSTTGGLLLVDFNLNVDSFLLSRRWYKTRQEYQYLDIQGFTIFASQGAPNWIRSLWYMDVRVEVWENNLEML